MERPLAIMPRKSHRHFFALYVYLIAAAFGMVVAGMLGWVALSGPLAYLARGLCLIFLGVFAFTLFIGLRPPADWAWPNRRGPQP